MTIGEVALWLGNDRGTVAWKQTGVLWLGYYRSQMLRKECDWVSHCGLTNLKLLIGNYTFGKLSISCL